MIGKWSYLKVPYRGFDDVELEISRTLNKSPFMIRFYSERMLLEFEFGRQLTPEEQQHLATKVSRSAPRWGMKKLPLEGVAV